MVRKIRDFVMKTININKVIRIIESVRPIGCGPKEVGLNMKISQAMDGCIQIIKDNIEESKIEKLNKYDIGKGDISIDLLRDKINEIIDKINEKKL